MSRALWLPDVLKAEGLRVGLVAGWETRGSDDFDGDDPEGVMFHHTVTFPSMGTHPALPIVTFGRSDLPGPLAQLHTPRLGDAFDVYVVASGRANHAGWGGPLGTVPLDSGNRYFIGNEVENAGDGSEPWHPELLDKIARIHAAILRKIDRPVLKSTVPGHKEWTTRKIDPNPVSMTAHREAVDAHLRGGFLMALSDEAQTELDARTKRTEAFIVGVDKVIGPKLVGEKGSRLDAGEALGTMVVETNELATSIDLRVETVEAKLDSALAKLDDLLAR